MKDSFHNSTSIQLSIDYKGLISQGFWLILILIWLTQPSFAQFNTAIQDGVISAGEYGSHVDGQNQQTSSTTVWYVTWDNTNLYLAYTGSNFNEPGIFYLDHNPVIPVNGGTDADGSTQGFFTYDRNHMMQPFRADFVLYMKNGYHEYRLDDAAGYWGANTANTLTVGTNGGTNTVEIAVPWNVITGAGRPAEFNWFGYKAYDYGAPTNGIYHTAPVANPECACNQDPSTSYPTYYYTITSTANGSSTLPFSQISFTYYEDNSTPGTGGFYLNGGTFYDVTVNDNSADNNDNDPVNHAYDNNEISNRLLVDGSIMIGNNLHIAEGSALLPADNIGPAILATITMNGSAGSVFNEGRLDANPEVAQPGDWNNRRIDFIFDGTTTLEPSDLFKDRYRFSNVTVTAGNILQGPSVDSVNFELQFGTLDNNGSMLLGDGSAGYANVGIRGDIGQHNDYFFNTSGASGVFVFHDLLIGRNSSKLQPVSAGNACRVQIKADFENYDEFDPEESGGRIDLIFNGVKRQYIKGNTTETTGPATTFHNIEIANDNGAGDNNDGADVHFISYGGGTVDYNITGELKLTVGDLVTRERSGPFTAHNLTLKDGSTVDFSGAVSDIGTDPSCFVDGPLIWEYALAISQTREFPIGKTRNISGSDIADYRHVSLDIDHDAATVTPYTAEVFIDDRSTFYTAPSPIPEVITNISEQHYWNVSKGAGANVDNADITLSYDAFERNDVVSDAPTLRIVKDNGGGTWENIASGGPGGTANYQGTIQSNPITTFGDFTLANMGGNLLPIDLLDFQAAFEPVGIAIRWTTLTEENVDRFEVERSTDLVSYTNIQTVKAIGHAQQRVDYLIYDTEYSYDVDVYYYRLKVWDKDSTFRYSFTVSVPTIAKPEPFVEVFPNPSSGAVNLSIQFFDTEVPTTLKIYNILGAEIRSVQFRTGQDQYLHQVRLPSTPQVYYFTITHNEQIFTRKVLVR